MSSFTPEEIEDYQEQQAMENEDKQELEEVLENQWYNQVDYAHEPPEQR